MEHTGKTLKKQSANRFDCLDENPRNNQQRTCNIRSNERQVWRKDSEEECAKGLWAEKMRRTPTKRAVAVEHELLADLCERTVVFCNIPIGTTTKEQELIKKIFCGAVKDKGVKLRRFITADDIVACKGQLMITCESSKVVDTLMNEHRGIIVLYASKSGKGRTGHARGQMTSFVHRRECYGSVRVRRLNNSTEFAQPHRELLWIQIQMHLTPIVGYIIIALFQDQRSYLPVGELFTVETIRQHSFDLQNVTGTKDIAQLLKRATDIIEAEHGVCIAFEERPKGQVIVIDYERQQRVQRTYAPVALPAPQAPIVDTCLHQGMDGYSHSDDWPEQRTTNWADIDVDCPIAFPALNLVDLPKHEAEPQGAGCEQKSNEHYRDQNRTSPQKESASPSTCSTASVSSDSSIPSEAGAADSIRSEPNGYEMTSRYWEKQSAICKYWKNGSCCHGSSCKFGHPAEAEGICNASYPYKQKASNADKSSSWRRESSPRDSTKASPAPARFTNPEPAAPKTPSRFGFKVPKSVPQRSLYIPSEFHVSTPPSIRRNDRFGRYGEYTDAASTTSESSSSSPRFQAPGLASPPLSEDVHMLPPAQSQPGSLHDCADSLAVEGQENWENVEPAQWSTAHVASWLRSLAVNIARYADLFQADGVDGEILLSMDDDNLAEIVHRRLHRRVIRKNIEALKTSNVAGEGQAPSTGC